MLESRVMIEMAAMQVFTRHLIMIPICQVSYWHRSDISRESLLTVIMYILIIGWIVQSIENAQSPVKHSFSPLTQKKNFFEMRNQH